jgi:hypothetical protein
MDNRALGNGQGSSRQNPKPSFTRARQIFGWWPPLGWAGLISGSHAKNTSEQAISQRILPNHRHFVLWREFSRRQAIGFP